MHDSYHDESHTIIIIVEVVWNLKAILLVPGDWCVVLVVRFCRGDVVAQGQGAEGGPSALVLVQVAHVAPLRKRPLRPRLTDTSLPR